MKTDTSLKTTLLKRWGAWAVTHWGKALIIGIIITIIASIGFSMLHMEMTFYSILPQGSQKVKDLKEIIENFPLSSAKKKRTSSGLKIFTIILVLLLSLPILIMILKKNIPGTRII